MTFSKVSIIRDMVGCIVVIAITMITYIDIKVSIVSTETSGDQVSSVREHNTCKAETHEENLAPGEREAVDEVVENVNHDRGHVLDDEGLVKREDGGDVLHEQLLP